MARSFAEAKHDLNGAAYGRGARRVYGLLVTKGSDRRTREDKANPLSSFNYPTPAVIPPTAGHTVQKPPRKQGRNQERCARFVDGDWTATQTYIVRFINELIRL